MIYLDNAATTKLKKCAKEAMMPYFDEEYANPSGLYLPAGKARRGVEEARDTLAGILNAERNEIVFTSGGSESNNLAIRGFCLENRKKGKHIVTSLIEHPSVLNTMHALEREGFEVTYVKPDSEGIISPEEFEKALRSDTILASVMHANNEIGVVQDIKTLAGIAHGERVCFHTDAVQSFGHEKTDVQALGVDMLSISSHKFGGPKGTGALYIKSDTALQPVIYGGEQERGLRAGTENVPGIVGMATAACDASKYIEANNARILRLRDMLINGIMDCIPDVTLNGSRERRLAGNVNLAFHGVQGESIIIRLSAVGICAATGSACTALSRIPSHVLTAIGLSEREASSSVRITIGADNTEEEIEQVIETMKKIVSELRMIRR